MNFTLIPGGQLRVPVYSDEHCARDVSDQVFTRNLAIPALSPDVGSTWATRACERCLKDAGEVGAIESTALQLWPGFEAAQAQVSSWTHGLGFGAAFDEARASLLACFGASFHDDGHGFGENAFCVLWLSDDTGLDLYFPHSRHRVPLAYGTAVVFDSCQPHGVVERGALEWCGERYFERPDPTQLFLSWDMSLEHEALRTRLGIQLFAECPPCEHFLGPNLENAAVSVDSRTGAWHP